MEVLIRFVVFDHVLYSRHQCVKHGEICCSSLSGLNGLKI